MLVWNLSKTTLQPKISYCKYKTKKARNKKWALKTSLHLFYYECGIGGLLFKSKHWGSKKFPKYLAKNLPQRGR